jgi:hypothetical protein
MLLPRRRALLEAAGWNFYASEQPLRYGASGAGSGSTAGVCESFVNVINLRDPLQHVLSHINELMGAYVGHVEHSRMGPLARHIYAQPSSLGFVQSFAPAVLDNLYVRSLLGRGYMCRLVRGLRPAPVASYGVPCSAC